MLHECRITVLEKKCFADYQERYLADPNSGPCPFFNVGDTFLLKRTIKTPKMYFFDTGLVAYLTKYSSPEILMNGAINGAILENYTVAEIMKTYHNNAKECNFHYYRDKESNEIDLVMESDSETHPLEIKKSSSPGSEMVNAFKILDKGSLPRGTGAILCLREELSAIGRKAYIVPIWMI